MSPAKHSAICAEIQQLHQAKESKLLARIEKLEAQRTWVGLTGEEIEACYKQGGIGRAAQILKEKNT